MDADGAQPKLSLFSCPGTFPNSRLCFPWGNLDLAKAAHCQLLTCPRLLWTPSPAAGVGFGYGHPDVGASTSSTSA